MSHKNSISKIAALVLSLGFVAFNVAPVMAATAQVAISVVKQEGGVIPNTQITCTDEPPAQNGWPQPPIFTYLVADSNGQATWTVDYQATHKYGCGPRSAVSPDGCYYLGDSGYKYFDFGSSLSQSMTMTGHIDKDPGTPASCSSSSTSQSTKSTKPTSTTPAAPASTPATAPTPDIKLTKVIAGGKDVAIPKNESTPIIVTQGNKIILSGTSSAVTQIIVKVFSDPKTFTGIVKSDGTWEVRVPTTGLAIEKHRVEISGSDPAKSFATLALRVNAITLVSTKQPSTMSTMLDLLSVIGFVALLLGTLFVLRKKPKINIPWLVQRLTLIAVILLMAGGLLIAAFQQASKLNSGTTVLTIGFLVGFIPIMIELFIAWRNHTLFIRDKATIISRQARNRRIVDIFIGPSIVFAVLVKYFPHSLQTALAAISAGYLLPYSIFLTIHFVLHHKEIEKIALAIKDQ